MKGWLHSLLAPSRAEEPRVEEKVEQELLQEATEKLKAAQQAAESAGEKAQAAEIRATLLQAELTVSVRSAVAPK